MDDRKIFFDIRVIDLDPKNCLSHFKKFIAKTKQSYEALNISRLN